MRKLAYALAALTVAGCASKSSDISGTYVSPVLYQNYTCQQLGMEAQAISARAAQVSGAQDQKRTNDAIATGVAIVVFWPAAFLVSGDGPTAAELAQLKGQMTAVEQASIMKNCAITFNRTAEAPGQTIVTQQQPIAAPPAAPQKATRAKAAKQQAPAPTPASPPVQQTVVIAQPPAEPALTERDGFMNTRN